MAQDVSFYSLPVNVRQGSTGTAANSTIWSMRNDPTSTKTIVIEEVSLNMSFDMGTPLGRSLQRYDFIRFSAATPTSGTALTVVSTISTNPTSAVTDARFVDTGLTTTGITFGTAFLTVGVPATDSAVVNYQSSNTNIYLNPGEGLCIRLNNASVAGQSITGFISWSER